ncbi:MAG: hypothetical protein MUP67_07835 [Acidimicrobiia bacterium]|nr:hypothetical protein [Acidimicrobiia bacterium]
MLDSTERETPRIKVLVEAPVPYSFSVREASVLSECDVTRCTGPLTGRDCPILAGTPCPKVNSADVVVFDLGLDTETGRQLLVELKRLHPEVAPVVLAWRADRIRYTQLLQGCQAVTFPWTLTKLQAAIHSASVRARHDRRL